MSERTKLLDAHFPKQEFTAEEYYFAQIDGISGLLWFNGCAYDSLHPARYKHATKSYSLYQHDCDNSSTTITRYDIVSIYDTSDVTKRRAFLQAYLAAATDDDIHDLFNTLTRW